MKKSDCIFCKITAGEIPSYKIWENEDFVAFLDIFPGVRGQTLVIPKKHYDADILAQEEAFIAEMFLASKKVADLLKNKLSVERVGLVVEWMEVAHAHIKLYPFYDAYGFHGTLQPWPQASWEDLENLQQLFLPA